MRTEVDATTMDARTYTKGDKDHTTLTFEDADGSELLVRVPNDVFEDALASKVEDIIEARLDDAREEFQELRTRLERKVEDIEHDVTAFLNGSIKDRFDIKRPVDTDDEDDAEEESTEAPAQTPSA